VAGEPHARFVHLGATSQDVIDTSLMVRLKELRLIAVPLDRLIEVLLALRIRDSAMPLMAHIVVRAASLGAFGAIVFTVGKYGPTVLGSLFGLIATFYFASAFVIVLGLSILKFLLYIKDELLIVLGISSERARPQLMAKVGKARLLTSGSRSRRADGLFLQPRRHQPLHDAGYSVYRAGARPEAAADDRRRGHADLEGRLGRYGDGLHHSGRDHGGGGSASRSRHGDRLRIDKFMNENRARTNIIGNGSPRWSYPPGSANSTAPSSKPLSRDRPIPTPSLMRRRKETSPRLEKQSARIARGHVGRIRDLS
jgi:hypothetical protein